MRWVFEQRKYQSDINGFIIVQRFFGQWSVHFARATQTNSYTNAMWKNAFKQASHLRDSGKAGLVLCLGLGGGGSIRELYRQFPGCSITAIEYDPVMIAIARDLQLWAPYPPPHIIGGEAGEALAHIEQLFDIITVDLFDAAGISPLLRSEAFTASLRRHLSPGGIVLVNASRDPGSLAPFSAVFPHAEQWRFRANALGAFFN